MVSHGIFFGDSKDDRGVNISPRGHGLEYLPEVGESPVSAVARGAAEVLVVKGIIPAQHRVPLTLAAVGGTAGLPAAGIDRMSNTWLCCEGRGSCIHGWHNTSAAVYPQQARGQLGGSHGGMFLFPPITRTTRRFGKPVSSSCSPRAGRSWPYVGYDRQRRRRR